MDNVTFDELYGDGALKDAMDANNVRVRTYVHCDYGCGSGYGPWALDTELVLPVFHAADTCDWERYLFNLHNGTNPVIEFPYAVDTFTAALLFCCMKVIHIQGGTDVSGSKESLFNYLMDHFFADPIASKALNAPVYEGKAKIGLTVLNMLSNLLDTRSSSSDSLKHTEPTESEMASLVWTEILMAVGDGIAMLMDPMVPVPLDNKDETLNSYSLIPYGNQYISGYVAAQMYNMRYVKFNDPSIESDIEPWRRNEAAFVLSAGLIKILRILCGSFNPGMITELFADECLCDGCTFCKINPLERHVIASESLAWEPISFPDSMAGALSAGETYYPPFAAMTFCRGYASTYETNVDLSTGAESPYMQKDDSYDSDTYEHGKNIDVNLDVQSEAEVPEEQDEQKEPDESSILDPINSGGALKSGIPETGSKSVNDSTSNLNTSSHTSPHNSTPVSASSVRSDNFSAIPVNDSVDAEEPEADPEASTKGLDDPLLVKDFWSDEDEKATKDNLY